MKAFKFHFIFQVYVYSLQAIFWVKNQPSCWQTDVVSSLPTPRAQICVRKGTFYEK